MLMRVSLLMQDGGRKPPEAMSGHLALVSHPLQPLEDRIVAHRLGAVTISREEPITAAGKGSEHLKCLQGLLCKRHDVRRPHLHAFGGDVPTQRVEVEFAPLRFNQFAGPHKRQSQKFDCKPRDMRSPIDLDALEQVWKLFGVDSGIVRLANRFQNVASA